MTKRLTALFAALCLASTLTAAEVTINLPAGATSVGNPLNRGDNSLNTILPSVPVGTKVYRFHNATGSWSSSTKTVVGWLPNLIFAPGEGFLIEPAAPITVTFSGEPVNEATVISIAGGYTYQMLASCQLVPLPLGNLGPGDTLHFPTEPGDYVFVYNGGVITSYVYFSAYGWVDDWGVISDGPIIPPAGGFLVRKAGFARTWAQTPNN